MDIIRKYSKTHRLQKQNYATAWRNKIVQWEKLASLKRFYTNARISCHDETHKPKLYKGICETTFKKRYANHKKSFNVEKNKNDTKLSTEYWKLANNKFHPQISWSIKGNYKSYNPNSKRCSLFLHKKLKIVDDPKEIFLNKHSEVISQCRHRNKYKLKTVVSNKKERIIT